MVQCVLHCSNVALCQFYVTQLIQQESKEQTALGTSAWDAIKFHSRLLRPCLTAPMAVATVN